MTPTSNEARPEEIIWLSGQPRHDALLRRAFPGRRVILVMDPDTVVPYEDTRRADLSIMLLPAGFCHVLKDRFGCSPIPLISWWTRVGNESWEKARASDYIVSLTRSTCSNLKGFAVCA